MTRTLSAKKPEKGSSPWTLFVDPGSTSAGWATFLNGRLQAHGTWKAKGKDSFKRLTEIREQLIVTASTFPALVEVHIETLNYQTSYVCIWSVGVIGEALTSVGATVFQDVWITSWQKHAEWKETKGNWSVNDCASEDEWAAIKMGEWYHASRD